MISNPVYGKSHPSQGINIGLLYKKQKKNKTWHFTLLLPGTCKREVFHSLRQEAYLVLNSIVERNEYIFKVINLDYHRMNL
jgi:hypothetical protein